MRPEEAEAVIVSAARPYPEARGDGKWLVIGRGVGGGWLQVIFILDQDGRAYVIHARPLTNPEKHRYRRRQQP